MNKLTALLAFLLLSTVGCSKSAYYWYHPDRTLEQARQDYCECKRHARDEATQAVADECFDYARSPSRPSYSYSSPHESRLLSDDPLDAWQTYGETYEQNVFAGCMKQRGYEKTKAHRLPADVRTSGLSLGAIAGR